MAGRLTLLVVILGMCGAALAQQPPAQPPARPPLGTTPPATALPRAEFAFEARVTLSPAVVLGETAVGRRQYIPITGGSVAGPKFKGEVLPGGWDYQMAYPGGCGSLTADYFWRAEDGTVIHILNEGFNCPPAAAGGERSWLRPRFEAPKGPHEWLTHAHFVATLELDPSTAAAPGAPPRLEAIRIKFYQIK